MGSWAYVPADVPDARLRVRILEAPRECEVKMMAAISTDVEMERKRKVRAHATTRRRLDFGFRAGIVGAGEAVQRPQAGDPPRAVLPLHAALARQRARAPAPHACARWRLSLTSCRGARPLVQLLGGHARSRFAHQAGLGALAAALHRA